MHTIFCLTHQDKEVWPGETFGNVGPKAFLKYHFLVLFSLTYL